jgi:hypothetical protein
MTRHLNASSSSSSDELEIDVDALAATRAAVRGWRDAHARGSTNLDAAPELFRAATAATANERGDETGTSFLSRSSAEEAKQNGVLSESAVARAVASAPSPRVAAFLRRGNRHASEVAAAPELFCEAAQGVASAAKTCRESLEAARAAFDVFVASLGGVVVDGVSSVVDSMPTNALLAVIPLGDDLRTAEQWVWLVTSVLEALARETEVVNEVAGYVGGAAGPSASAVETSAAEGEKKLEPLDFEKLAGCAEVWRARAFVDEALLRVLVDAEA